jgi:hypothetical protein
MKIKITTIESQEVITRCISRVLNDISSRRPDKFVIREPSHPDDGGDRQHRSLYDMQLFIRRRNDPTSICLTHANVHVVIVKLKDKSKKLQPLCQSYKQHQRFSRPAGVFHFKLQASSFNSITRPRISVPHTPRRQERSCKCRSCIGFPSTQLPNNNGVSSPQRRRTINPHQDPPHSTQPPRAARGLARPRALRRSRDVQESKSAYSTFSLPSLSHSTHS